MYLSIIILPLLGSIVSGFFGRKVGVSGAHLLTCSKCNNNNNISNSCIFWSRF